MASTNETVLLKSTLEIQNKSFSVKLTASEIYWEVITSARASGGPYSEPLVMHQQPDTDTPTSSTESVSDESWFKPNNGPSLLSEFLDEKNLGEKVYYHTRDANSNEPVVCTPLSRSKQDEPMECLYLPLKALETESQTVKLGEIIAVKLGHLSAETDGSKFRNLEMVAISPIAFSIWVVKRMRKHRWHHRKVTFSSKDTSVIQQWVEKIQEMLTKPEFNRPKSLLVFVNPVGGSRKGPRIYRDRVAPLFDLAEINIDLITTQRANHARDTLLDYDLSKVDGIVSIGGDGMFSELIHGLLLRTLRDSGGDQPAPGAQIPRPKLRIGIIPAGSTDTISWSTQGINDVITSTLHIIVGDSMAMDVATVHHGNQFLKYDISMCAYGYYGDCIVDSERNRWMGPHRYDWSGFKKVIALRSYEGEVSFLPSPDKENHPTDGTNCKAGCQVCQSVASPLAEQPQGVDSITKETEGWKTLKGRFVAINSFTMSCRCRFSPEGPAPSAHLGDGCMDLVLVHQCSRADYVKHLYRCSSKKADQFNLPFIDVHRVKEFKFRPLVDEVEDSHEASDAKIDGQQRLRSHSRHNSVWNCDGEVIEEPAVDVRMYRHLIQIFARGIEEESREGTTGCMSCHCTGHT